jgi:lipopolysaccharide assembly outer membrane protein LptD (OstA)
VGRNGIAAAVAAFLIAAASSAWAQEPTLQERLRKSNIEAANAIQWQEGDQDIIFLTGGVTMKRPDMTLQAGRVMLWRNKDSKDQLYDEIYAEGNVIFARGPQKLTCERFFYNNLTRRGAIVDVRLKAYSKDLKSDFFAMAKEARISSRETEVDGKMEERQELVADDCKLTSCSYGVPHYHLTVDHATLLGGEQPAADKKGHLGFAPFGDDWTVDFDQLVPEFSGIPFLYVPGLSVGPWLMNFPIRAIRVGHSSVFGNFVYSDFGSRIRIKDENGKERQWGDINLKFDWRQVRGEAGGIDFNYKWDGYWGYLDSYYLYDRGRRPGSEFDQQFPPLDNPNRGKVHWFHRQDIDEHWRYELEVYYLSDSALLQEFFPREFREEKPPESAAYVRWLDGNMGAFLLARYRLNNFQTQDNYLPRADFNLLSHPILAGLADNVYLTERVDVVDIRHNTEQDLLINSVDTWRVDALTQVSTVFDLTYLQISPFIQNRLTYYEDDLAGDARLRDLWTGGVKLTTQVHATHSDFTWERVGIRGLRHVVEFETGYTNNFSNNVPASDLFPYEPVDQLDRFEEVSFQIRQRFLTKDASNKPFEFLTCTVGIEYYPDSLRDTTFANVNNFEPPFNWIPVLAQPNNGVYERRNWSNVNYEVALRPHNIFTITAAGEYNPETHAEEIREVGITVTPIERFTLAVGQERVRGVTDAFTLGMTWALTPKWSVSVFGQYDFRAAEYLKQELVVARDFHDFAVEAVYERDFTRAENRFLVAFVPKFLGKAGERRSHLYKPGEPTQTPTDR